MLRNWNLVISFLCALTAVTSRAQTFTSLSSFDYSNGARPYLAPLVQGADGDFYGTTTVGGANGPYGEIFKITPGGKLSVVHSFGGFGDGAFPSAGLVLGTDGNFYGATEIGGGAYYSGTIFKITPDGTLTTLHSFCNDGPPCADGAQPDAAMIQAINGDFYGTTQNGGTNGTDDGTVFKIRSKGKLTTLYSFCSEPSCADGSFPNSSLVQASDGYFYGTTFSTLFKITAEGALTTLHTFTGNNGSNIIAGLVQATDGNLYGTASAGGPANDGTVFAITPEGAFTILHTFDGDDGITPEGNLVLATEGDLYGTTLYGGTNGEGTVFKITPSGILTTLYNFCGLPSCSDGSEPAGALLQATNGILYGTTSYGGSDDEGTVFSVASRLKPFVLLLNKAGRVNAKVQILGQGLDETSAVAFNGVAAKYTIVSDSFLTAAVPAGATTGYVTVKTASHTLTSRVTFKVVP